MTVPEQAVGAATTKISFDRGCHDMGSCLGAGGRKINKCLCESYARAALTAALPLMGVQCPEPKLMCTGCGSTETIEEIRAKHPQAISCCPERDMQPPQPAGVERPGREDVARIISRIEMMLAEWTGLPISAQFEKAELRIMRDAILALSASPPAQPREGLLAAILDVIDQRQAGYENIPMVWNCLVGLREQIETLDVAEKRGE